MGQVDGGPCSERQPLQVPLALSKDRIAPLGVSVTVATSWKIDSASAARFTLEFHRRLKDGQAKGAAMRQAALAVMRVPEFQHPYYWSGFSLLGQGF